MKAHIDTLPVLWGSTLAIMDLTIWSVKSWMPR